MLATAPPHGALSGICRGPTEAAQPQLLPSGRLLPRGGVDNVWVEEAHLPHNAVPYLNHKGRWQGRRSVPGHG